MPTHCRRELTAGVALFRDGQLEEAEKRLLRAASQPSRFAFMNGGTSSDKATVIDAKFALAQIYKTWGSFEKAAQLLGEVHKANQIMLGETASATLLALAEQGAVLYHAGHLKEAHPLMLAHMQSCFAALGGTSRETLVSMHNFGRLLLHEGKLGEAQSVLTRALSSAQAVLGPEHASTLLFEASLRKCCERRAALIPELNFAKLRPHWQGSAGKREYLPLLPPGDPHYEHAQKVVETAAANAEKDAAKHAAERAEAAAERERVRRLLAKDARGGLSAAEAAAEAHAEAHPMVPPLATATAPEAALEITPAMMGVETAAETTTALLPESMVASTTAPICSPSKAATDDRSVRPPSRACGVAAAILRCWNQPKPRSAAAGTRGAVPGHPRNLSDCVLQERCSASLHPRSDACAHV